MVPGRAWPSAGRTKSLLWTSRVWKSPDSCLRGGNPTVWRGCHEWRHGTVVEETMTLEEALVAVWRGALVEGAVEGELDGQRFPVRETPRKQLREVDFVFEGQPLRGLEQNPKTESRVPRCAKALHKLTQSLAAVRYICNAVDGKVTIYG